MRRAPGHSRLGALSHSRLTGQRPRDSRSVPRLPPAGASSEVVSLAELASAGIPARRTPRLRLAPPSGGYPVRWMLVAREPGSFSREPIPGSPMLKATSPNDAIVVGKWIPRCRGTGPLQLYGSSYEVRLQFKEGGNSCRYRRCRPRAVEKVGSGCFSLFRPDVALSVRERV